jgi:thymidylate synthase ThyX
MKKINAEIVADSVNIQGNRITTYVLTYPRMIHAEVMTHRMFSRNAASSRAIPFEKMLKMVEEDPFIPIAWQKDHKGMQGTEYIDNDYLVETNWLMARDKAIEMAKNLSTYGVTKQICNRLLEPFQWYTCLVTATEYDGFFDLRCPKYTFNSYYIGNGELMESRIFKSKKDALKSITPDDQSLTAWLSLSKSGAEIHIQALAEAMWDAKNESKPQLLKAREWHIPFGDKIGNPENLTDEELKIATARCARLSYLTFDDKIDYQKDLDLFNMLLESKHMSPFEHCARVMTDYEYTNFQKGELIDVEEVAGSILLAVESTDNSSGWCNNFKGFIPYRYIVEKYN